MRVTLHVLRCSKPDEYAPKGRWSFCLRNRSIEIAPNLSIKDAYSAEEAERRGRTLARRMGLAVNDNYYIEKVDV